MFSYYDCYHGLTEWSREPSKVADGEHNDDLLGCDLWYLVTERLKRQNKNGVFSSDRYISEARFFIYTACKCILNSEIVMSLSHHDREQINEKTTVGTLFTRDRSDERQKKN
jgi:hypothetical protein